MFKLAVAYVLFASGVFLFGFQAASWGQTTSAAIDRLQVPDAARRALPFRTPTPAARGLYKYSMLSEIPRCPSEEIMAEVDLVVKSYSEVFQVKKGHPEGVHIDSQAWALVPLEKKLEIGEMLAMYLNCHVWGLDEGTQWSPIIDFYDNRSGKRIGRFIRFGIIGFPEYEEE